jgi:hypothetical protein
MAGRAAAMITASSAEIKAVRTNMAKASQNRPDLPAKMFFLRGPVTGSSEIIFSWSPAGGVDISTLDMISRVVISTLTESLSTKP